MKKQKAQQKPTKDDLVRLMATKFLGEDAYLITDEQLEKFCEDYLDYKQTTTRTDENYNGDYHYKSDGTFKDDLQTIINKHKNAA
jgi:hypothetical protein